MSKPTIESHKQNIINQLEQAENQGLTKSKLKINKTSGLKYQAFQELEKQKIIMNLGNKQKTLYVLKQYFTPLEMACDLIESKMNLDKLEIFSKTKLKNLAKGCPTAVKNKFDEAIVWLTKENKFLKVKQGRNFMLLYVPALCNHLPKQIISNDHQNLQELTRENVVQAYKKVKQRIGFSNVEIYELQQEMNVPMDVLKEFIIKQKKQGRVMLTKGDWSLSSEEIRSGAINLDGNIYLLVRFHE